MTHIYPQAEPFFLNGSTEKALLFIHGFTASPSEVYPIAQLLYEKAGYTVSGLLLPGHGSTPQELNQTRWQDWFEAVKQELHILFNNYSEIFVAGLSLGGLLALHAACKIKNLRGAVVINASIYNNFPLLIASAPVMRYIKPYFPKKDEIRTQELEEQGRFAYKVTPVKAFRSMISLRNKVIKELGEIDIPLLIMQSLKDESVNPRSAQFIMDRTHNAGVRLVELHESEHIATMGTEKEKIAGEIVKFIDNK